MHELEQKIKSLKIPKFALKEDAKVIENTFCFFINPNIKRGDPALALLKEFSRNSDPGILQKLLCEGVLLDFDFRHNLIAKAGRGVFAQRLASDFTYTGAITRVALGSGTTPLTENSSHLNTEVFRTTPDSTSFDNNIAYIDTFIEAADVANQTFQEYGTFIDGTDTINTGQPFTLLITGGWAKSGAMYISSKYTLV